MRNGPFVEIDFSYMNDEVVFSAFVPKVWLISPCEDYTRMAKDKLENSCSNFPIVKANRAFQGG